MKGISIAILTLVLVSFARSFVDKSGIEKSQVWEDFKAKFSKTYESLAEEEKRRLIFMYKLEKIEEHNLKFEKGEVNYTIGINQFSDMTADEVPKGLAPIPKDVVMCGGELHQPRFQGSQVPDGVDWRSKGIVTDVKDQKQCGSCWAFSATGALEGQHALKTSKLVSLSEQDLLDCQNIACEAGSLPSTAFEFIAKQGIDSEESYPYKGVLGKCEFNPKTVAATDMGCRRVPPSEDSLKEAVASVGPISVAIDARGLDNYQGGIYYSSTCSSTNLDHAVLVVGYGTNEKGEDYWIVKNSWGTFWGDNGYLKMARNHKNMCGIATFTTYPLV